MIRDAEIDAQLQRILESSAFVTSERSRQFLEFCVNRAMRGQASHLKETTIAIEVFLRATDYDPKSDPIVRVHARRVREKLDHYYRTTGTDDPIRIDLPKGGYVPLILRTLPKRKTEFSDWEEPAQAVDTARRTMVSGPILSGAPADTSRGSGKAQSSILIAALMLGVALVSFTLAWVWRGASPVGVSPLGALKPIDSLPGNALESTWSPDGSHLAFAAAGGDDGRPHIYIKDARSGDSSVRLTEGNATETRPVWSPNGDEIAFARQIDLSHFEIARFDLKSKAMSSIGPFVTYWPIPEDHPALDWSPDGKLLLTAEQAAPANPMRILLISLATGERTFLTSPPIGSSGDIDAKFSPDGQLVAFRRGGLGDLYVVSIKGERVQPAVRLTFDTKGVRGLAWVDHGRSILFGTQRGQTAAFGLWKISLSGGSLQQVSPPDFDAVNPAISSTGAVVIEHRQIATELVEHTLNSSAADRVLMPSNSADSSPVYSPDGSSVAFTSTRTGWGELWLYRAGEAKPKQLTHFQGEGLVFGPSWAPDGGSILFSFRKNGATNIVVCDLAHKTLREITSTRNRDISPVYSSDGRFIYFSSNDDGTSRIWRIRADVSDRAEPLFLEAVVGFLPSPDGRWLYFIQEGEQLTLSRRSLLDSTTEEIFHTAGRSTFFNSLAIANGHIYIAASQDDLSTSEVFEIEPNARSYRIVARLKDLPPFDVSGVSGFSISPDGSRLIASRTKRNDSMLYTATFIH